MQIEGLDYNTHREKLILPEYGREVQKMVEHAITLPSKERDNLVKLTANQMKRCLYQWSHGSSDDEKVASDLAKFTDGKIQLDLSTFKFEKIDVREFTEKKRNNKKK